MALTRSLLRAEAVRGDPPATVLRSVNGHLLEMNDSRTFVTMLYGILDQRTHEFAFVRAGHDMPLVFRPTGEVGSPPLGLGVPLGILPDPALDEQTIALPPGSALLLFTDGVTEALDAAGDFFETERLHEVMRLYGAESPRTLCDRLLAAVTAHHTSVPQSDDITMLAVQALRAPAGEAQR
jgi:sigma-B regulation protein RsbU (phosphoserine phosphatase)